MFDLNGIEIESTSKGDTPRDFIANLHAGLPNFQNAENIPVLIEVLEDYGLPTDIAIALREIYAEGWPERTIVAAFLMALSKAKRLSSEFPRELSRLVFAGWKRTDMNPNLLERIEKMIENITAKEWKFDASIDVAEPAHP